MNICIGKKRVADDGDQAEDAAEHKKPLVEILQSSFSSDQVSQKLWWEWLWCTDPMEECDMDVMLNRMQLLGFLIMQRRSQTHAHLLDKEVDEITGRRARQLCLFDKLQLKNYKLRQFLDTLENLRLLWFRCGVPMLPFASDLVDALMACFGKLARQQADAKKEDTRDMEVHGGRCRIAKLCIRKVVNTCLILCRHLHCWQNRVTLPSPPEPYDCGIKLHHILAGTDDFHNLSMHWDLMPAARLIYVHDFKGLYNCVSQVFYSVSLLSVYSFALVSLRSCTFTTLTAI
jgi:hypothetical protein